MPELLAVGDKILRKRFTLTDGAKYGIIRRFVTSEKVAVDWQAPYRINGDGWHRSTIKLSALIRATDEEIQRRRDLVRAAKEKYAAEMDAKRVYSCTAPDNHGGKVLHLQPGQVKDGKCLYCGAAVVARNPAEGVAA